MGGHLPLPVLRQRVDPGSIEILRDRVQELVALRLPEIAALLCKGPLRDGGPLHVTIRGSDDLGARQ